MTPTSLHTSTTSILADVPPYSLPDVSEVAQSDDWTEVTDRKAKKRIQNRVAQRTYRQRMKARLAELQAKVHQNESQNQNQNQNQGAGNGTQTTPVNDDADGTDANNHRDTLKSPVSQPKLVHESVASSADVLYSHSLSDGLSTLNGNGMMGAHLMASASQSCRTYPFTPHGSDNLDSLDMSMSSQPESRKSTDSFAQLMRQMSFPMGASDPSAQTNSSANSHCDSSSVPMQSAADCPSPDYSANGGWLDDRIECVMECAAALGFPNFDALVTTYYNEAFRESSYLSNEQRLSRNRRLPGVVTDLVSAAKQWTAWERRNFYEEILKSAEDMLITESNDSKSRINAFVAPIVKVHGAVAPSTTATLDIGDVVGVENPMSVRQAVALFKSTVPDQLPNLWALMMALAASFKTTWQHDHSGTALAAVIMLQFGGRIDNEMLLDMICSCL